MSEMPPRNLLRFHNGDEQCKYGISNEKLLFLYNRQTGLAPYTHRFAEEGTDPHLLASFISAMSTFMEEIMGGDQSHWRTEYGNEATLIVEGGDWVVGCLVITRETNEARSKLRRVVREFEDGFVLLKDATSFEGSVFEDFDKFVLRVFIGDRITENTRVWRALDWSQPKGRFKLPSLSFRIATFLSQVTDGVSIRTIIDELEILPDECTQLIAIAVWNNVAYLQYVPAKTDILSISTGSISFLLNKENPLDLSPDTMLVVSLLDGHQPLENHLQLVDSQQHDATMLELGDLATRGFIQRITIEQSLLLVSWCTLEKYVNICRENVGANAIIETIQNLLRDNILSHPWLGRIRLSDSGRIRLELDQNMLPTDYDQLYEDLEFVLSYLKEESIRCNWFHSSFLQKLGINQERSSMQIEKITQACQRKWEEYIRHASL